MLNIYLIQKGIKKQEKSLERIIHNIERCKTTPDTILLTAISIVKIAYILTLYDQLLDTA